MTHTRNASRLLALVMALALVFSLSAAAFAADDAGSVEFVLSSEGMEASAKVAFSLEEPVLSLGAGLVVNGENLAGLTAYLSAKALALESNFLDKAYGVELEKLADNLANSIFAPNSGSQYALDEDTYNQIQELLSGGLTSQLTTPQVELDTDAIGTAVTALAEMVSQVVADVGPTLSMQMSPVVVTVNDQQVSASQMVASGNSDTILAIWDSVLGKLEADPQLQNALAVLVDAAAAYSDDLQVTGQEFVSAMLENAPELRQSLADELAQTPVTISGSVYTATESQTPVKVGLEITMGEETVSGFLVMSEAKDFFRLEMNDGYETTALQFHISQNTDTELAFRFGSYQGNTEVTSVRFQLDKSAQTFHVGIDTADGEEEVGIHTTFSGYYENTDDRFSLVLDKVDDAEFGGTLAVHVRSNDTLTFPTYTELTHLSETEFAAALEALSTGLSTITQLLGL